MGESRLRVAAVAHVHANDVGPGAPHLVGVADHILRLRRTLQAMHQDHRRALCPHPRRMPVALAQHAACDLRFAGGRHLHQLRHRRRQSVCTRQEDACDRLQVAVAQKEPRHEGKRLETERCVRAGRAERGGGGRDGFVLDCGLSCAVRRDRKCSRRSWLPCFGRIGADHGGFTVACRTQCNNGNDRKRP